MVRIHIKAKSKEDLRCFQVGLKNVNQISLFLKYVNPLTN
ncbi:hypothetical protein SAMN05444416_10293 [Thermoactinomyces sp. DSM 45892]|nr:hypothetical protein SAMN05444416_10293 [Thermoactinomyces sp. DSM 45892]